MPKISSIAETFEGLCGGVTGLGLGLAVAAHYCPRNAPRDTPHVMHQVMSATLPACGHSGLVAHCPAWRSVLPGLDCGVLSSRIVVPRVEVGWWPGMKGGKSCQLPTGFPILCRGGCQAAVFIAGLVRSPGEDFLAAVSTGGYW